MTLEVLTAANAVTTDTNTDFTVANAYGHPEMFIQIEITSTFTVQILGRITTSASFVELIAAVTVDTIQPVAYMPFIRVTTSGGASTPICSVYIMIGSTP